MKINLGIPTGLERAIPIAIMATLALVSISLLKSSPTYYETSAAQAKSQLDYYLREFSTAQINDVGKLKSFIRGRYAEHSQVSTSTAVQDFLFASTHKYNQYYGQSSSADIFDNSNELILKHNAVINRISLKDKTGESDAQMRSHHLKMTQYPETITSQSAVYIVQAKRKISAGSMQYDADIQQMRLGGAVKIKSEPKIK